MNTEYVHVNKTNPQKVLMEPVKFVGNLRNIAVVATAIASQPWHKLSSDDADAFHTTTQQRQLQAQKQQLDFLLKQPIRRSDYCGKYPTQSSKPTEPFVLSK